MTHDEEVEIIARLKGKKKGGKLDGYHIKEYDEDGHEPFQVAYGYIHGDSRWSDGRNIRTSVIVAIHEDMGVIETRNTYYDMGEPATKEQETHLLSDWY